MVEERSEPARREADQRRDQEPRQRQSENAHVPARTAGREPSSAAGVPESAAAVLDRLREVAAAHDQD